MKIKRDGVTIELTSEEMRNAYYEQRRAFLGEDIQSRYDVVTEDLPAVIERVEHTLDCNDSFWDSYWMSIEYTCEDMGYEEKGE